MGAFSNSSLNLCLYLLCDFSYSNAEFYLFSDNQVFVTFTNETANSLTYHTLASTPTKLFAGNHIFVCCFVIVLIHF